MKEKLLILKEKLLILDDEALILMSLEHLFEDDYEVFTTNDAETALRLAVEQDIAVIMSDERMPGVSGHEFLRRVREVSKATRVMMSGFTDMSVLTEAINSGQIFAFIEKPWAPRELKAKVSAAVVHFKLVQEVDQERALLRALMENIPDLIYFKDRQSRFTRVNQAHARNLGAKDSAECVGKSNADYFKAEDALRWRLQEEEMVRSGQPLPDQVEQLKNPRGGLGWWSTTKVPMFDRNGQVSGIAGISRNITALMNSEALLREQNECNRMILETANDAFIGMDPDGSITTWNVQAEVTFGWTAAEAMGRLWCDTVVAPAYREAHAQGVEKFLTTAQGLVLNRAIELVALHRDGHEFPVEATVWPVLVNGACSVNAFVRDISERKKAEEALSNSERKYRSILESAPDAVVVTNGDGEVVLVNSQAERMFGHPREGLLGRHIALLFTESCRHEDLGRHASYLTDPETRIMTAPAELFGLRKDGAEFPIEVSLSRLETSDGMLVFNAIRDVTERKNAEQRSRQLEITTAEAEAASKAKSVLLATMSHEIRTPLNAILGYSELMLRDPGLGANPKVNLKIIHRSGEHLLRMINDILAMAKLEAGRMLLVTETFELRRLLGDLEAMFRLRTEAKAVRFEVVVDGDAAEYIAGDQGKIRQVLINLLGNAVKFTERGRIDLRVGLEVRSGDRLWLSAEVADTGIGMTAEEQGQLFQPFVQGQAGQRMGHGGTGLGLAISLGVARLMGGDITVSSSLESGSIFRFEIPVECGVSPGCGVHPGAGRRVVGLQDGADARSVLIPGDETAKAVAMPPAGPSLERLRELPGGLIQRLHDATFNGDKALLDELIPTIGKRGDAQSAQALQDLADRYQYDRLIELLEEACPR